MSIPQRSDLLRTARDKAQALIEKLQQDEKAVAGLVEGQRTFAAAIDAAHTTLDNLNRALQGAPSSTVHD